MNLQDMSDDQFRLLFDVRRSIRYHDRRRAFFERLHQITGGLTVLLSGSVLFDIARPGDSPAWLLALATVAAVLAAWDIVVGYAAKAGLHRDLKARFVALEIRLLASDDSPASWSAHQGERLAIERDEPPIYRALDVLCHNELLRAEGFGQSGGADYSFRVSRIQRLTRHLLHWADIKPA